MAISDIFLALLKAVPWTLLLTGTAFIVGAILAIPLCAIRLANREWIRQIGVSLILTFRSIPPIVWLFLIYFGLGQGYIRLDPFTAAVIGFGLITSANLAEVYRGALTAVPVGQFEAAKVVGLNRWQMYTDIVIPQVFRIALPSAATYAIALLKDSAIASTIGYDDIANTADQLRQITYSGLTIYALAGVLYLVISLAMAWGSRKLDYHLRQKVAV